MGKGGKGRWPPHQNSGQSGAAPNAAPSQQQSKGQSGKSGKFRGTGKGKGKGKTDEVTMLLFPPEMLNSVMREYGDGFLHTVTHQGGTGHG